MLAINYFMGSTCGKSHNEQQPVTMKVCTKEQIKLLVKFFKTFTFTNKTVSKFVS